MPVPSERPSAAASVALARSPGETSDLVDELTDALLELRAAQDRLRRVDSILSRLLGEIQLRLDHENVKGGPADDGPAPNAHTIDVANRSAPGAEIPPAITEEDLCAS